MRYEGGQYYVKSEEEMRGALSYTPRRPLRTPAKIAERCNVEIEFGVTKLPRFDVPEGYDSWGYLNHLCARRASRSAIRMIDGTLTRAPGI